MSRRSELLEAAADALEDYADPFSDWFLREHAVTLDEVTELGEDMAIGARVTAWAVDNPRRAMALIRAGIPAASAEMITEALAKMRLG